MTNNERTLSRHQGVPGILLLLLLQTIFATHAWAEETEIKKDILYVGGGATYFDFERSGTASQALDVFIQCEQASSIAPHGFEAPVTPEDGAVGHRQRIGGYAIDEDHGR